MFKRIIEKGATRRYLDHLPALLQSDHGLASSGVPLIRQRKCRKRYNETSSVKLICHTPLQCSPPKRFRGIPSSGGFPTENAAVRSKIAVAYFDGNIDFAYRDVGGSSGMILVAAAAMVIAANRAVLRMRTSGRTPPSSEQRSLPIERPH
jgi:hypothetical protein